jgi:hypothetical protein
MASGQNAYSAGALGLSNSRFGRKAGVRSARLAYDLADPRLVVAKNESAYFRAIFA